MDNFIIPRHHHGCERKEISVHQADLLPDIRCRCHDFCSVQQGGDLKRMFIQNSKRFIDGISILVAELRIQLATSIQYNKNESTRTSSKSLQYPYPRHAAVLSSALKLLTILSKPCSFSAKYKAFINTLSHFPPL